MVGNRLGASRHLCKENRSVCEVSSSVVKAEGHLIALLDAYNLR